MLFYVEINPYAKLMMTFLCPLRVEQQKMPRLEGIGGFCTSLLTRSWPLQLPTGPGGAAALGAPEQSLLSTRSSI